MAFGLGARIVYVFLTWTLTFRNPEVNPTPWQARHSLAPAHLSQVLGDVDASAILIAINRRCLPFPCLPCFCFSQMPPFIREDPGNGWSHSHGWWKDDCDNPPHETRLKRGLAPGRFIGSKRGHTNTSGDLSLTRVMPMYM